MIGFKNTREESLLCVVIDELEGQLKSKEIELIIIKDKLKLYNSLKNNIEKGNGEFKNIEWGDVKCLNAKNVNQKKLN